MNKDALKNLILFNQERKIDLVERELKVDFVGKINSIIGPRRAGKTFFVYQLMNLLKDRGLAEKVVYINFEDERLWPIEKDKLRLILEAYYELYPENKGEKIYLFLDEIQNVPLWQKFVRRVYDQENVEICITGSSSKILSKEIATELRGRTLSYFVFPYSFKEFLKAKGIRIDRHFEYKPVSYEIKKMFEEYIKFGGFPEIADKDEGIKIKILQEYFDLILYKDMIERYQIRNIGVLKEMLQYMMGIFSSYFSVNKYYNLLKSQGRKISKSTLFEYASYIADINFIFLIPKYSSIKEQIANPKKVYIVDTGLINAISFRHTDDFGKFYENVVFIHLKRQGKEIYYWKNKYECDFLVKEGTKIREGIQVCYELSENKDRKVKGLIEAMDNLKFREGLIITRDEEGEEKVNGKKIKIIPLWKWLLE